MTETDSLPDNVQSTPRKPFLLRVVGVFIEPGETFEDIAANPDWIAPLILLVLFSLSVAETMLARIGMRRIIMHTLEANGQASSMNAAQLSRAESIGATVGAIFVQGIAVFAVPIFLLIVAGVGLLILNGFFGQKARFKQVFAVTCYADMPAILGCIMAIAVMFFADPDAFNPRSPAPTNLGYFLNPQTTSHALMALANSLDFVIIWFIILLAMGLSRVVKRKVKTGSIFGIYAGMWVLVILAKVGIAVLTGK